MIYDLQYKPSALKEIEQIKRSGNKALFKKLTNLLHEIIEHPRTGTGQVEQLKHYPYKQTWSRRLNQEYRLVYEIHDDTVVVLVVSLMDHSIIIEKSYNISLVIMSWRSNCIK